MPSVGDASGARPNFARIRPFLSPNARLAEPSEDSPSVARTLPLSSPIASPAEPSADSPNRARTCPPGSSMEKNGDSSFDRPMRRRTLPAASTTSNSSARTTRFFMSEDAAANSRRCAYRRLPEGPAQAAGRYETRYGVSISTRSVVASSRSGRGVTPMPGPRGTCHRAVGRHRRTASVRSSVEVPSRRARVAGQREPRQRRQRQVRWPGRSRSRACRRTRPERRRRGRRRGSRTASSTPPTRPCLMFTIRQAPSSIAAAASAADRIDSSRQMSVRICACSFACSTRSSWCRGCSIMSRSNSSSARNTSTSASVYAAFASTESGDVGVRVADRGHALHVQCRARSSA